MLRLLICFLLCTCYLTAQPSDNDLARACSYFVTGNYMRAFETYKSIVYHYVPQNFTLEQVKQKVPPDQLMLFCYALEGKLQTEIKLGIINLSDEGRILSALHPNAPVVMRDGDYLTIDMHNVDESDSQIENDVEFSEFVEHLRKIGMIEKNEDVVWDDETKSVRLKLNKPCCKDCADGKPCADEKKSQ